ncbi:UDP-N-acetylmuramoylalanine/D-glutamate ligase [Thermodesulfatator indicus DSM 15286]|uniref:UDP-N-acetylmuramoylalanine--D-glutamate ligase n=1 Tax=Thermodesulfatator indicus (strain DSM 15286 / JCM 11887 / CIR29812) TaxID=667014 RepID=F8AAP4_THEID|nr:UDP-N-acetylmuramoyl-L-alanine--D-glutamate ligase [Thermodesulfatator indicus]AEH44317.1 UDP-N-acetylmuramoylalanine/D-glutamate ligase [Thermodesulfatator indicus DSM 15286]
MLEGKLAGKKVVVLGFGRSGQAATRLLLLAGARVVVSDSRPKEKLPQSLVHNFEEQGVLFDTGAHRPEVFEGTDLVVISPGVPPDAAAPARERNIPVIGELELGYRFLLPGKKILAITGTNGKTTTTAMATDILRLSGKQVFVGGNYGTPLSEFIINGQKADYLVLETSSFQLESIDTFRPQVAVILNITPDHLERYAGFKEYALAKARIYENQTPEDFVILPEELLEILPTPKSKMFFLGKKGTNGAELKGSSFVLHLPSGPEEYSLAGFKLLGEHNRLNFTVAALAARLLGATPQGIKEAIKSFIGFPHRLEFVGTFGGVYFVNDSKATNVDATLKALRGLSAPIILIMGGKHKGSSYRPLMGEIKRKVKLLILMGESRYVMAEDLRECTDMKIVENLEEAVAVAISEATLGDTVLLSPAAASFDQFENYQERGDVFKELVKGYAPQFLGEDNRSQLVTYH